MRFQSVPGGRASSQDWNPVSEASLIASSTTPSRGLAPDHQVVGVERGLLRAQRLPAAVVGQVVALPPRLRAR